MNYENILTSIDNNITTITINRPTKLNALNKATIEELHHAFAAAAKDKQTKVIILTGTGEKAFVAGADIAGGTKIDVAGEVSPLAGAVSPFWFRKQEDRS